MAALSRFARGFNHSNTVYFYLFFSGHWHPRPASDYGIDYLLTWNCKHIANAQIQRKLAEVCLSFGYRLPTICTPYELMGE
jgi:hypothetical protein